MNNKPVEEYSYLELSELLNQTWKILNQQNQNLMIINQEIQSRKSKIPVVEEVKKDK